MSQDDIFINGELLRLRREARGWVLNDMATRACMSVKQIRQLEEGGISCFYSVAVKATSAKKVGALLGLSPEEIFAQEIESTPEPETADTEIAAVEVEAVSSDSPLIEAQSVAPEAAPTGADTAVADAPVVPAPAVEVPKSKASLWVIAALFVAALAVAAYMQPQDVPVVEAAPPLQTLPTDVADPASAADLSVSSADVVTVPASATATGVPVASGAAAAMGRPAGFSMATPASSSASKAP